jgi:ankyrin repeat protein
LNKGADVNAQGGFYGNALQAASFGGYQEIVVLLLNKGANMNTQGGRYGNALQVASFRGHQEIAALLQNNSAITSSNRPGSRAPSNPVKKPRLPDPKPADYPAPEDID